MAGIYQIVVRKDDGSALLADFEKQIEQNGDWVRIAPNCYLVHSKRKASDIYNSLKRFIFRQDNIFVCRLDLIDREGWFPKWVWEWIDLRSNLPATGAAALGARGLGLINNTPSTPSLPRNRLLDP